MNLKSIAIASAVGSLLALGSATVSAEDAPKDKCLGIAAAGKNDMTLALEISIGSSAQIALMVAPLLVILGPWLGQPMALVFNAFELAAIGLSVATVALVALDGESNWLEGLQLLALYVILAAAFYIIPA